MILHLYTTNDWLNPFDCPATSGPTWLIWHRLVSSISLAVLPCVYTLRHRTDTHTHKDTLLWDHSAWGHSALEWHLPCQDDVCDIVALHALMVMKGTFKRRRELSHQNFTSVHQMLTSWWSYKLTTRINREKKHLALAHAWSVHHHTALTGKVYDKRQTPKCESPSRALSRIESRRRPRLHGHVRWLHFVSTSSPIHVILVGYRGQARDSHGSSLLCTTGFGARSFCTVLWLRMLRPQLYYWP